MTTGQRELAMESVTLSTHHNPEHHVKPRNADLLLGQGYAEQGRADESETVPGSAGEVSESLPPSYMLLISRIDNMMRKGQPEPEPVEQLGRLLVEKIARMTVSTRRILAGLPQVKALEVEDLTHLPRTVTDRIQVGDDSGAVMDLLRSPVFAAQMKNETRSATYGPQGFLRAS